jgi:hypothetical protein
MGCHVWLSLRALCHKCVVWWSFLHVCIPWLLADSSCWVLHSTSAIIRLYSTDYILNSASERQCLSAGGCHLKLGDLPVMVRSYGLVVGGCLAQGVGRSWLCSSFWLCLNYCARHALQWDCDQQRVTKVTARMLFRNPACLLQIYYNVFKTQDYNINRHSYQVRQLLFPFRKYTAMKSEGCLGG